MKHCLKSVNLEGGYGKKTILKDVSITIPTGKISVIIGANASGKSTLLKHFARLLTPMSGSILLNEKSFKQYPSKQLAQIIGLLPQSPTVSEGIKVYDLVARGRFPYQRFLSGYQSEDYQMIEKAMKVMKIDTIGDKYLEELSGGQRQRVWIAMALAQNTDILFLDEPTTYLDVTHQIEILDLLKTLNKEFQTTIVMVLHDINLAIRYADYMFAMKQGELLFEGDPEKIVTEKLIEDVFDLPCMIMKDPYTLKKMIIPKSKEEQLSFL